MSIRLLLVVYVFCIHAATAQKGKAYLVKVGEIPKEVLPREAMYVLPAFTGGTVLFRDGTSSVQRFNYNFLLDEMHFIGAVGDTLAIANPELIKSVVIDSMMFYYNKGYLREVFRSGKYNLVVKQNMEQVLYMTRGAYDAASGASSIKTFESINNNGQRYQLQVKKDVLFQVTSSFYLGNTFNIFLKADKKNFHILFSEKKITKYIKENKINFNQEEDLIALLKYCVQ